MKAIIGGTGIDKRPEFGREIKRIDTEYGCVEYMEKDGIILLPRHGQNHKLPPHRINYRANIEALSLLGVNEAVGIYAVGSITDKVPMMGYGILSDFMDFSGRNITFFDKEVHHASLSHPFDSLLSERLKRALPEAAPGVVYVTTNGPRLESSAEIRAYGILGGDVVGMTGGTEAVLMREKGISFASLVYSINWGTGVKGEVTFLPEEEEERMAEKALDAAFLALEE